MLGPGFDPWLGSEEATSHIVRPITSTQTKETPRHLTCLKHFIIKKEQRKEKPETSVRCWWHSLHAPRPSEPLVSPRCTLIHSYVENVLFLCCVQSPELNFGDVLTRIVG